MIAAEIRRVERAFPSGVRSREHRFFGCIVETVGLPLWGRASWWLVGRRPGDHRDWPAIDRRASWIAAEAGARRPMARTEA